MCYLHVGGPAPKVLRLRRPPGCSAASSFLLSLRRSHHHKVHTHLTGLLAQRIKANDFTQTNFIQSSYYEFLCQVVFTLRVLHVWSTNYHLGYIFHAVIDGPPGCLWSVEILRCIMTCKDLLGTESIINILTDASFMSVQVVNNLCPKILSISSMLFLYIAPNDNNICLKALYIVS